MLALALFDDRTCANVDVGPSAQSSRSRAPVPLKGRPRTSWLWRTTRREAHAATFFFLFFCHFVQSILSFMLSFLRFGIRQSGREVGLSRSAIFQREKLGRVEEQEHGKRSQDVCRYSAGCLRCLACLSDEAGLQERRPDVDGRTTALSDLDS